MSRVYFTDRDLGKQFPGILRDAGLTVERHGDLFLPDGPDEQWLEHCGRHRRVALTHNLRIRYVPNELAAVVAHSVTLLVLMGKAPTAQLAHNFVRSLDRIDAVLAAHAPPLIAKVYLPTPAELRRQADAPGRVEVWYP